MRRRTGAALSALLGLGACVAGSSDKPTPAPVFASPARVPQPHLPPFRQSDLTASGRLEQGGWIKGRVPPGTTELTLEGLAVPIAADGEFFAGFDRDASEAMVLIARAADGRTVRRTLAVAPRSWLIERVNAPLRGTAGDREFATRRSTELAAIAAARAQGSDSDGWRQDFVAPAQGRYSGRFGSQRVYRGIAASYHSGLDIAGGAGSPFTAPADGVVVLAAQEPFSLEGLLVIVDHGMGLASAFLHASRLDVRLGDRVRKGQRLGSIGATGRASGPHLHWSVTWQGNRLDPEALLANLTNP